MKVKFEQVLDGLNRYINSEIYGNLTDLQEMVARIVVGRVNTNSEAIKVAMMNNGIIKTFGVIDTEGMVDVDAILHDIRKEIERKGTIEFTVPMIGKLKFTPSDVDALRSMIARE